RRIADDVPEGRLERDACLVPVDDNGALGDQGFHLLCPLVNVLVRKNPERQIRALIQVKLSDTTEMPPESGHQPAAEFRSFMMGLRRSLSDWVESIESSMIFLLWGVFSRKIGARYPE